MFLSHDIWTGGIPQPLKAKLQYLLDYANTENCLFTGYWRSADMVQAGDGDIYASVYANGELKRALIVFVNGNNRKQDLYLGGTTFDPPRFSRSGARLSVKRVFDVETDQAINTVFENGRMRIVDPMLLGWHDCRLLMVEFE
jgi:hypothetical protein